jgi:hypothetical protein
VRISGSNAGYTMFRGSVKSTEYPFHSLVFPLVPLPVRHRVPSYFNWFVPHNVVMTVSRPVVEPGTTKPENINYELTF